jgi:hypothetical protein
VAEQSGAETGRIRKDQEPEPADTRYEALLRAADAVVEAIQDFDCDDPKFDPLDISLTRYLALRERKPG